MFTLVSKEEINIHSCIKKHSHSQNLYHENLHHKREDTWNSHETDEYSKGSSVHSHPNVCCLAPSIQLSTFTFICSDFFSGWSEANWAEKGCKGSRLSEVWVRVYVREAMNVWEKYWGKGMQHSLYYLFPYEGCMLLSSYNRTIFLDYGPMVCGGFMFACVR